MIFSSLLLAVSMNAAPYQGPDPARLLLLAADACQLAESMKAIATDPAEIAKSDEDRKKALSDLQENASAAMKSGGDSGELQTSLKAFYGAAETYCRNPSNAGKNDLATKENTLDKMLDAAGR